MNTHYQVHGKALALCNAFGFLFPGELFTMQAIVQSLPDDAVVVQIGAGVGTGSLGMVEMKPSIQMYTIDISEGGPFGGLQNERNAFADTGLPLPHQILGDSQEVWKDWKEPIDLIFIDGDHSETGLQRDIDGWLQFLKPGGYVLFHDYQSVNWHGVTSVVDKNMDALGWVKVMNVDTLIAFRYDPEPAKKVRK
jgi:predicted O-methyltransferase YrrM